MDLTKDWAATLDDYVIDLVWSPDGTLLAAASAAGPISVFARDGKPSAKAEGHDGGTNALAFMPKAVAGLAEAGQPRSATAATENLLASGGQDGCAKIWNAATGHLIGKAECGSSWVEHISWSPASGIGHQTSVLAATAGRELTLLDPSGNIIHRFDPAPKTITALAFEPSSVLSPPSSNRLAVACFGRVALIDLGKRAIDREFAYNNGIHALAWSPDGKWLVSGNQDPSVHLWIPADGSELHMSGYETKVTQLSFDHTSHWLATSGGRDACIWDCSGSGPEGREPKMLPHDAPVSAVSFQHSHGVLASASQDGVVMLWSPERTQPLRATVKMPIAATKLAWSPDDKQLAIGTEKGALYVLKVE